MSKKLTEILEKYGCYCGDDCNGDFDSEKAKKEIIKLVEECIYDLPIKDFSDVITWDKATDAIRKNLKEKGLI